MHKLMIALLLVAGAAYAAPPDKPVSHVTARGTVTAFEGETITFDVDLTENHGQVSGAANWVDEHGSYSIAVDCITVVGDEAWVSGTITSQVGSYPAGSPARFALLDNKGKAVDMSSGVSFTSTSCGEQFYAQLEPLASGSVHIR